MVRQLRRRGESSERREVGREFGGGSSSWLLVALMLIRGLMDSSDFEWVVLDLKKDFA